jgi:hypothetical protein
MTFSANAPHLGFTRKVPFEFQQGYFAFQKKSDKTLDLLAKRNRQD